MHSPFTPAPASCYIGSKPRGPVLENTKHAEVATPTVKRGFVSSKFRALRTFAHRSLVTGGMGISVRTAARLRACFQHPVHLLRLKTQSVAPSIHAGIQTMTVISQASRRAARTKPTTGTIDPIQLHADAHNALNMAVFYLRQPQANTDAARRKAIQALAALRGLSLALEG